MTQHKNTTSYFRMMAAKAKTLAHRIYWLGRAVGKEEADRARAADAEAKRKIAEREANLNDFANCDAPFVGMENKHPNGCIVYWNKPANWEPDTYIVLVRESPLKDWRSAASKTITRDTRSMVLTKSYLAWGEYREPYYIAVAAVRNGVGRKLSNTLMYPPDFEPEYAKENKAIVKASEERQKQRIKKIKIEPMQAGAEAFAGPFKARHQGPAEEPVEGAETGEFKATQEQLDKARAQEIIGAIRTYAGRRTRKGRPYTKDFREHLPLNPRVKYSELRKHWKMLRDAPTGD